MGGIGKRRHEVRFWSYVNRDGPIPAHRPELGKCWIWKKFIHPKGYGIFAATVASDPRLSPLVPDYPRKKRQIKAHRWSFLDAFGYLPSEIDHLCRNRACVRPSHLEDVDHATNWKRGMSPSALNLKKENCTVCGSSFVDHIARGRVIGRRCPKQNIHAFLKENRPNV